MNSKSPANSPLWLDLLVASGMIGAAYAVDRYVLPTKPRETRRPESDKAEDRASAPAQAFL